MKRVGFAPPPQFPPELINTHTFPPLTQLLVLLDFLHLVVVLLNNTFTLHAKDPTIAQYPVVVHRTYVCTY